MPVPQRIAITGASGLIGTALVGHLKSEGHTVQRFVRRPVVAPDEIQWDPKSGYVDNPLSWRRCWRQALEQEVQI
ncbi:MAG: hypothetical protein RL470_988 [Actinomycetota bacterium]